MNLTDQIEALFEKGVIEITMLRNPKESTIVIQAKHFVETGPNANRANVVYQVEDKSLVNAINTLSRQVDHSCEMKTRIIQIKE